MADLSNDIAEQVIEPITSAADGQSSTGRSVEELIRADQYLAAKSAITKRRRGVYFSKISTPGAMSDQAGSNPPANGGFCGC